MTVRWAAVALVAVALLLPSVLAQVPELPPGTPVDFLRAPLRLVPGEDIPNVEPLRGFGATNLSVQVHCSALDLQAPTTVELAVAAAPSWATVTVSPSSIPFPANTPPATCANEWRVQDAVVLVSATAEAPAFQTGAIQITGTYKDKSASGFVNATAGAYTDLEAAASQTRGSATPDKPWEFVLTVTNRGNSKINVDVVGGAPRDLVVTVNGVEIGSRQAGDPSNQAEIPVKVAPRSTLLNGEYPVWVNLTAVVPGRQVRQDVERMQMRVAVTGAATPTPDEGEDNGFLGLPGPATLAALLAVGGVAFASRRRAR